MGGVAVLTLGPRDVFLVAGLLAALAVPAALSLPPLPSVTEDGPKQGRLRPDRMDLFYFAIGLSVDGLFGMTLALFLAERTTVETALVATGLLLAMRHFIGFAVTPLGGLTGWWVVGRLDHLLPYLLVVASSSFVYVALADLIPGWTKGLEGKKVGSRVLLVLPPADGFPEGSNKPAVEKGDTVVYVVDLLFANS